MRALGRARMLFCVRARGEGIGVEGWRGVVGDVPRALCAPMARDVALVLVDRPRALAIASAHVDPAWQPSCGCPCARARALAPVGLACKARCLEVVGM